MSACRSCDAPILWVVTQAGRSMPLDPDPVEGGNVEMTGRYGETRQGTVVPLVVVHAGGEQLALDGVPTAPRYVSHFATCPNADEHRRPQ